MNFDDMDFNKMKLNSICWIIYSKYGYLNPNYEINDNTISIIQNYLDSEPHYYFEAMYFNSDFFKGLIDVLIENNILD